MFTVTAIANDGTKVERHFMTEWLMMMFFKNLIKCCDAHSIEVIDGLTGEVLWHWVDGDYEIANGVCLK